MVSQRVGHDLATEQQQQKTQLLLNINSWYDKTDKNGFGGQKLNYSFLLKS